MSLIDVMTKKIQALLGAIALGLLGAGCASQPAAPFDTLKTAEVTAFRLQNYQPPPPSPGAAAPSGAGLIPAQIQQWVQAGATGLQQLLPPGLVPPGLLRGVRPTAPPAAQNAPRFEGFRILSQIQVIDPDLKQKLADIFGHESNFDNNHANCMYAEMGLSFVNGPGMRPNDLLISFSCNQVQARTFPWPFPETGMKPDTVRDLASVVNKLWPPGT